MLLLQEATPEELAVIRKLKLHLGLGDSRADTDSLSCSWTALHYAAATHKTRLAAQLLDIGADPSQPEPHAGLTPLHLACLGRVEGEEQLQELLDSAEDVYELQVGLGSIVQLDALLTNG